MNNKQDSIKKSIPIAKSGLENPIDYQASDSIYFDIKKRIVYLWGKASIAYGNMLLTASYIEVDLNKKEIFAKASTDSAGKIVGTPVFKDGDDKYETDSMRYNMATKTGKVYGLTLKQDELFIQLSKVQKEADGSFIGQNGKITTCNLPHPHFYFDASKVKVLKNTKAVFGPANLVIEDVPTPLAVPFGMVPPKKQKRNGILFPSPGYFQSTKSYVLSNLGWYQGLGKYADLTLMSDIYMNSDFRVSASTKFIKRYKFNGALTLSYSSFQSGERTNKNTYSRSRDFAINGNYNLDRAVFPGTSLSANINIQTGGYNKRNISGGLGSLAANTFSSGISFSRGFFNNKMNLTVGANHRQNTNTHDFILELPNISVGVSSLTPFARKTGGDKWFEQIRITYNLNAINNLNTKDSLFFAGKIKQQEFSNGVQHSIPITTNFKIKNGKINISPSISYSEFWFFSKREKTRDFNNKNSSAFKYSYENGFWRSGKYSGSISANTVIYGTFQNLPFKKFKAIRHTITPSIGASYTPKIDGEQLGLIGKYYDTVNGKPQFVKYSLFENSIYGNILNLQQAEFGGMNFNILNNFQGKKYLRDSSGKIKSEKFGIIDQLNFSTRYNFLANPKKDSTQFKWSDIDATLATSIAKRIQFRVSGSFSPYARIGYAKTKVQKTAWEVNKFPVRFEDMSVSLSTTFSADMFTKNSKNKPQSVSTNFNQMTYYDFSIPWSLQVQYNFSFDNRLQKDKKYRIRNAVNFSGDLSITEEWKITYQSGYDFVNKTVSGGLFGVARNLHCWQIEFSWAPIGTQQFWLFSLRPKSALLQDLKLNRRYSTNPYFQY